MIVLPAGQIGLAFAKDLQDPLAGHRTQTFTYELLNNREAPIGSLPVVTSGQIEWHANAAVKSGGKIVAHYAERPAHDWFNTRVKIVMHIEGHGSHPIGVFIPAAPTETWSDEGMTLNIELLDKLSIIDNDYVLNTYAVPKGTNVIERVRSLITSTGEKAGALTDSSAVLDKNMSWESGTSKLAVINDLLNAANYFSLGVDGNGKFFAEARRLPRNRPIAHRFYDDEKSIYLPSFTYERDTYSIPNKVVLIAQGDGDQEGLRAVATNENPKSPYSYQNRGRWIIDVIKGVDATSQEALQERANARLVALTSPVGTVSIDHAPLPWLRLNDAVMFRRDPAGIDVRAVVASTSIQLSETALQRTELQEVADV